MTPKKTTKKNIIAVRVDDDMLDFIEGIAAELNLSAAEVLRDAFQQYYFGEDYKND